MWRWVLGAIPIVAALVALIRALPPIAQWWLKRRRHLDAAEQASARLAVKNELESHLPAKGEYGNRGEAIMRDVRRRDSYPDLDSRNRGISPWFKVELKGLYHRGLEVFIAPLTPIVLDQQQKRWRRAVPREAYDLEAYPVGRIPFERIVRVDWSGDEYYPMPHIYCRFVGRRGEPYEEVTLYYRDDRSDFLWHLDEYRENRPAISRLRYRLQGLSGRVSERQSALDTEGASREG